MSALGIPCSNEQCQYDDTAYSTMERYRGLCLNCISDRENEAWQMAEMYHEPYFDPFACVPVSKGVSEHRRESRI